MTVEITDELAAQMFLGKTDEEEASLREMAARLDAELIISTETGKPIGIWVPSAS